MRWPDNKPINLLAIDGNLIEVLTGKDARAIAEVPNLIKALRAILDQIDPENTTVGLGNILKGREILKRIEG